jgi:hypothetical protein
VTTSVEKVNGTSLASPEPRFDPVALAEAEAIRTKAAAEAEALRIEAAGKAEAEKIKAAEEAEKQRLANERAALRFKREQAEQNTKIEEAEKKREDIARSRREADRQDQARQQAQAASAKAVEKAGKRWRRVAMAFYVLCAGVALPVQMAAFYNKDAKYLLAAPVFIELIALVALVGAAAAVTAGRPHWHYRLVAWAGALTAASINIVHGLAEFDTATAFGTALASIAGPGMWDLHEHGRIRKRDGKPSWRQRLTAQKEARKATAERAAEEARKRAEKEAADEAAEVARLELREIRQTVFKDVWAEAVKIGAALGKDPEDTAVWPRAYRNIKGCEPGESIESISSRRTAEKRAEAALTGTPVNTLSKTTNAQRANQMPRTQRGPARKPPARRPNDTQQYVAAARRQASIAAKQAAQNDRPTDN